MSNIGSQKARRLMLWRIKALDNRPESYGEEEGIAGGR